MFLYNCYIHKRTPELIDKLIKLGYRYSNQYDNTCDALHTRKGCYYSSPHFVDEHYGDMKPDCDFDGVDCGENEELFLAIAALQDDTDENQWFVCPKIKTTISPGCYPQLVGMDGHEQVVEGYEWVLSTENSITERINEAIYYGENPDFLPHKATIDELIKHFSNDR